VHFGKSEDAEELLPAQRLLEVLRKHLVLIGEVEVDLLLFRRPVLGGFLRLPLQEREEE
jgi:hypothetical protein